MWAVQWYSHFPALYDKLDDREKKKEIMDISSVYLYQFQFIVVGNKGVGKSSLLQYFATGKFRESMTATVGLDFCTKTIEIDRHNFKLQLWDTAGQERFRAVVRPYFRNAVGAILVFDISRRESFTILPELIAEVCENAKSGFPFFMLVGNKSDNNVRAVSENEAMHFASSNNITDYIETSARTGENIDAVFHLLTRKVYEAIQDGSVTISEWQGIKMGNELPNNDVLTKKITNVDVAIKPNSCCLK